jgi:predicted GIY-YIG superfamily endonuclease
MNYNQEPFPTDIKLLIQKCDAVILKIQESFSSPECLIVKDLYHSDKGHKQKDFIQKLQVVCNNTLNSKSKKENEVKGLYVFGELNNDGIVVAIYVGISRTIFRRVYQHTWGKKHNETSFSYLKAKYFERYVGDRKDLPYELLKKQQEKIKNYRLIVIPEIKDYDLYFMEVYIAGKLKTKWNSFKTH